MVSGFGRSNEKKETYVSCFIKTGKRVAEYFHLPFRIKPFWILVRVMGGFTGYSLRHGAKKVFAVDVERSTHPS